jgi:hypothetical protein
MIKGYLVGLLLVLKCKEKVRVLLQLAASDSQPAVLEVASKAQESWLKLLTSALSN